MPRLILLCGVPASGKSTYAASLMETSTAVYLSSDALIEEWAAEDGTSYADAYPLYKDKAADELQSRLAYALDMKSDIIWDQTNLSWDDRAKRLAQFEGHDYDLIAVAFEAPPATLNARLEDRETKTGKHIPADVVAKQRELYTRPHFDEGFDEIVLFTPQGATRL